MLALTLGLLLRPPAPRPDPALDKLEFLVGAWRTSPPRGEAVHCRAPGQIWLHYDFRAQVAALGPCAPVFDGLAKVSSPSQECPGITWCKFARQQVVDSAGLRTWQICQVLFLPPLPSYKPILEAVSTR